MDPVIMLELCTVSFTNLVGALLGTNFRTASKRAPETGKMILQL